MERIDGDRNPPSSASILPTEVYPTGMLAGPPRRSHGFLAVSKAADFCWVWGLPWIVGIFAGDVFFFWGGLGVGVLRVD